jgi:phage portal protein BeeE
MIFYKLNDISIDYNNEITSIELSKEVYLKTPYAAMVINRISKTAAYLKLKNNYDYFDVETRFKIYTNLLLFGECFILPIYPTGMSKINSFEVLVNNYVIKNYNETSPFKPIISYNYQGNIYEEKKIIHIKYSNPVSLYPDGLSPINSAKSVYKVSNAILDFERYTYTNRGAAGVLSGVGEMPITPSERQLLQDKFQIDTGGVVNANKIHVSPTEVKYSSFGFKPSEMIATESQLEKLRTICSLYNVDSTLFNDKAASTYNNMQEAMKAFYNDAVLPLCDYVHEKISNYTGDLIEIDYDDIDILKKDAVSDANAKNIKILARKSYIESLKLEIEIGILTLEEAKIKLSEFDLTIFQ